MVIHESKNIDWKKRSKDPTFAADIGSKNRACSVTSADPDREEEPDEELEEDPELASSASRSLI
jgi:hypothetical protein